MPIFEYRCSDCGERFEKIIFKSKDEDKITCPKCGKVNARKLTSSFAFSGAGNPPDCGPSGST